MAETYTLGRTPPEALMSAEPNRAQAIAHSRWLGLLAMGLWLLMAVFVLMPWQPGMSKGLDYSWLVAQHLIYEQGLAYGQQVAFTYGPWAFVEHGQYYPTTRSLVMGLSLLLILGWSSGLWLAAGPWIARHPLTRLLLLGLCVMLSLTINPWFTLSFVLATMLVMVPLPLPAGTFTITRAQLSLRLPRLAGWMLMLITAAWLSHMKLSYLVALGGAVCAAALLAFLRRQWAGAILLPTIYLISWVLLWVAAGQSIPSIPTYLSIAREIIGAYGDAMSFPGPMRQLIFMLAGTLAAMLMMIPLLLRQPGRWTQIITGLACAALLGIIYKSGIVREGPGHLPLAFGPLMAIALLMGARILQRSLPARQHLVSAGVVVLGLIVLGSAYGIGSRPHTLILKAFGPQPINHCITWLTQGDRLVHQQWEEKQAAMKQRVPHFSPDVTTDVYTYSLEAAIELGLPVTFRPTLQSYIATTRRLQQMNADHLLSDQAPKQILLMGEDPVDVQYPNMNDALSWPVLLTHYNVIYLNPRYTVLHRQPQPRAWKMEHIATQTVRLNEVVDVPPRPAGANAIWVTMQFKPTFWGRLKGAAYKRPTLLMHVSNALDQKRGYRILPDIAASGFMLSPVVVMSEDWLDLATRPADAPLPASQDIRQFMLKLHTPEAGPASYESEVEVSFQALYFEPQPARGR